MPEINSQADMVMDWRGLLEAVDRNSEIQPLVETERQSLAEVLSQAESLKARQQELQALSKEATQQLRAVLAQGRELSMRIRVLARGKMGLRSERLSHFRVAPLRSRRGKPVVVVEPPQDKLPDGNAQGGVVPSDSAVI